MTAKQEKKYRHAEYIKIYEVINEWYSGGFCKAISWTTGYKTIHHFPELLLFKPKKNWNGSGYWFHPSDEKTRQLRLTILEFCKEMTK